MFVGGRTCLVVPERKNSCAVLGCHVEIAVSVCGRETETAMSGFSTLSRLWMYWYMSGKKWSVYSIKVSSSRPEANPSAKVIDFIFRFREKYLERESLPVLDSTIPMCFFI